MAERVIIDLTANLDPLKRQLDAQLPGIMRSVEGKARVRIVTDTENMEREVTRAVANLQARGATELKTKVTVDTKDFDRSLDGARKVGENVFAALERRLEGLGLNVRKVAVLFGAGITGSALVLGLRLAVKFLQDAAARAEEFDRAITKLQTTIGPAAKGFREFLELEGTRAKPEVVTEFASVFSDLATQLGFSREEAGRASIAFSRLISDLASVRGIKPDEAFKEAAKAIGQQNLPALNRLIGLTSEAQIRQEAYRLELVKTGDQLDEAARAQAIASLIQREGSKIVEEAGVKHGYLQQQTALLSRQLDQAKVDLGTFANDLKNLGAVLLGVTVGPLSQFIRGLKELFSGDIKRGASDLGFGIDKAVGDIVRGAKEIGRGEYKKGFGDLFFGANRAAEGTKKQAQETAVLDTVLGKETITGKSAARVSRELAAAIDQAAAATKSFRAEAEKSLIASIERVLPSFEKLIQSQQQVEKTATKSASAEAAAARSIARARESLDDAIRKGPLEVKKAQEAINEAIREGAKNVAKAQDDLEDTIRRNTESIHDAERRLAQAESEVNKQRIQDLEKIIRAQEDLFVSERRIVRERRFSVENLVRLEQLRRAAAGAAQDQETSQARAQERIDEARRDLEATRREALDRETEARQRITDAAEESSRRISEAEERKTEVIEQAAERERDARQRLTDAIEAAADREIAATARVREATLEDLRTGLSEGLANAEARFKALEEIRVKIQALALGRAITDSFLFHLSELPTEMSGVLSQLAVMTPDAINKNFIEPFAKTIEVGKKDRIDAELNKFPPNLGEILERIRLTVIKHSEPIFESFTKATGKAREQLGIDALGMLETIRRYSEEGSIFLSEAEKRILAQGESATTAAGRVEALQEVINALEGRTIGLDVDTSRVEQQILDLKEFIRRTLEDPLQLITEPLPTRSESGSRTPSGRFRPSQFGGPFTAGELLLVGEEGPELAAFSRPGVIIPNPSTRAILRLLRELSNRGNRETINLHGGRTGLDRQMQRINITVNEVANDPEATANAVAARLGRMATR